MPLSLTLRWERERSGEVIVAKRIGLGEDQRLPDRPIEFRFLIRVELLMQEIVSCRSDRAGEVDARG
jgi:hypothetical protein